MNPAPASPAPASPAPGSSIPGRPALLTRRGRRAAVIAVCAVAGLLAAACSGSPGSTAGGGPGQPAGASAGASAAGPQLTISPASGSKDVRPGQGITVTAARGKITSVAVHAAGDPVSGTMNAARTSWHSSWTLAVSTSYTVTATAARAGRRPVTQTSSFATLRPARALQTMIFEGYHDTYGVGMPIILAFSAPVQNKAAVERSLQLTTSKPVVGAWHWDGSQALDFRPRHYWPAHTTVTFTGHLDGVEAAPGLYGEHTLTQSFRIGSSLIVVASTATHHMDLYRDGSFYRRWPISTGRPGDNTPNGTYLTIDKGNPVKMTGPGYSLEVPWSVRFTWTGDYLHDAYWSVGEQGFTNVSHGCVNMAPADAEIYYKMAVPGDPVTVTGSPKAGAWDNGWTEWFLSWPSFLKGSALHQAVEAGPHGSKFVSPADLPPATGSVPLSHPRSDNWSAA